MLLSLGSVAGPEKLQPLLDKNQEMFNAFVKAVEELAVLRNNLNKTEVCIPPHCWTRGAACRRTITFIIIISSSSSSYCILPLLFLSSFLPRDAMRGLCRHAVSVCLSVRLFVTFADHVKTNKHIFEIFYNG